MTLEGGVGCWDGMYTDSLCDLLVRSQTFETVLSLSETDVKDGFAISETCGRDGENGKYDGNSENLW